MRKFYIFMLTIFICMSCSDRDNHSDEPTFVPDESQIEISEAFLTPTFDAEGGEITVEFVTQSDWSVSVVNSRAENWCSISPLSGGAGKATFIIRTSAMIHMMSEMQLSFYKQELIVKLLLLHKSLKKLYLLVLIKLR